MNLEDIFEMAFSVKKTVWSRRNDKISRHEVDTARLDNDVQPHNKIELKNATIR